MADSGFNETTEGVRAKLSVEVPEQALTTLKGLAKQTQDYRIEMEAAARAQGNHMDYLEKQPAIAEAATMKLKEWCDQMERAIDLKGKLGGGPGIPGAVGQDSSSPFGETVLGRGDIAAMTSGMAQRDPGRILNMANARGLIQPGAVGGMSDEQISKLAKAIAGAVDGGANDGGSGSGNRPPGRKRRPKEDNPDEDEGFSPQQMENHALKGRDLVSRLLNETGPGTSMGDAVGAGRDVLGSLGGMGGALGSVGKFLGPVGAGVGLALTANELLQMGGQQYQNYKNMGLQAGQGAGAGMRFDADAKMLALDPFISTAQAREVIQGALSGGYGSNDKFDTVTQFLAKNLKDMNVQVSDSVKLLKTNVDEGGMSIQQLGKSMANVSALAKQGGMSQQQEMADFGANTSKLTALGANGNQGTMATQLQGAFANDRTLAGVGTELIQAMDNPNFEIQLDKAGGVSGGPPQEGLRSLMESGSLPQATLKVLGQAVQHALAASHGNKNRALTFLMTRLNQMGINIPVPEARKLLDTLGTGKGVDAAIQSGDAASEAADQPIDRSASQVAGQSIVGSLQGGLQSVLQGPAEAWDWLKDAAGGNFRWGDLANAATGQEAVQKMDAGANSAPSGQYSTNSLDSAVKLYGRDNIVVTDPNTGQQQALDQANKAQRDALISGSLQIGQKGQAPQALKDFGSNAQAGQTNVSVSAAPLTVKYEGPISGPTAVPLTANAQQAMSGQNGATMNHPPGGDR